MEKAKHQGGRPQKDLSELPVQIFKIPETVDDINYIAQECKKLFDLETRQKLFFNKNNAYVVYTMNKKIGLIND